MGLTLKLDMLGVLNLAAIAAAFSFAGAVIIGAF